MTGTHLWREMGYARDWGLSLVSRASLYKAATCHPSSIATCRSHHRKAGSHKLLQQVPLPASPTAEGPKCKFTASSKAGWGLGSMAAGFPGPVFPSALSPLHIWVRGQGRRCE